MKNSQLKVEVVKKSDEVKIRLRVVVVVGVVVAVVVVVAIVVVVVGVVVVVVVAVVVVVNELTVTSLARLLLLLPKGPTIALPSGCILNYSGNIHFEA